MKRHRNSTDFADSMEVRLTSPKKKAAESFDGGLYGGSGIGDSTSSPQLPLTRLDGPFSPHHLLQSPSAPLPIRSPRLEDSENYASIMSFSPQSLKIPVCSTPEELKSPHLRTPPPRPHKTSPPGSTNGKTAHPQAQVVHVPLQELITHIQIRPSTYRLFGFSHCDGVLSCE